ncbi:MAG TPA: hypothetical protein P5077_06975 [bacterium]|nr:hypothetical protein [bacterium]
MFVICLMFSMLLGAAEDIGKETMDNIPLVSPFAIKESKQVPLPASEMPELKPIPVTASDVSADLLVLYDAAIKADRKGKGDPRGASRAWGHVVAFKGENPFLAQANERRSLWGVYTKKQFIQKRYEKAKKNDKYGNLFPELVISQWEKVALIEKDNDYLDMAKKRIAAWRDFIGKVNDYQKKKKSFAEQRDKDRKTLMKILPLSVVPENQKKDLLKKYLIVYSPYYGVGDLDALFVELRNPAVAEVMKKLIDTPQFREEMEKSCDDKSPVSCLIAAHYAERDRPAVATALYLTACRGGIGTACEKVATMTAGKDDKTTVEANWNACAWGVAHSCLTLGGFVETGKGIERSLALTAKLYEKACSGGLQDACERQKIVELAAKDEREKEEQEARRVLESGEDAAGSEAPPPPSKAGTLDIGGETLNDIVLIIPMEYREEPLPVATEAAPFTPQVSVDATTDPDLLVEFDAVVAADRNGSKDPQGAISAWRKIAQFKEPNPYGKVARERIREWERVIRMRGLGDKYRVAVAAENVARFFPEEAIAAWKEVAAAAEGTPLVATARSRIEQWGSFMRRLSEYHAKRKVVAEQKERDIETLRRILPLEILDAAKKSEVMKKYVTAYGAVFRLDDLDLVLSELDQQKVPGILQMRDMVITPQWKKQSEVDCALFRPLPCAFVASMTGRSEPVKALEYSLLACKGGIASVCMPAGDLAKQQKNTPVAREAYGNACAWGFSRGCDEMAEILKTGKEEDRVLGARIVKRGCSGSNTDDCRLQKAVELRETMPVVTPKAVASPETFKETPKEEAPLPPVIEEPPSKRPYLWYGIGLLAFGVASAGAGAGLMVQADLFYKKYNDIVNTENLIEMRERLSEAAFVQYVRDAKDKYQTPGDTYSDTGIALISVGGAAVVTGLVLTLITEEAPTVTMNFDEKGFSIGYAFKF